MLEPEGMTVQLLVGEGAAARAWYERLLGRPPDFRPFDDDSFLEWQFRPGFWELHVVESPEADVRRGRVRIGVAHVDSARAALRQVGFDVRELEELPGVVRWCNLDDPWGNRLGLYQDLARFP